MKLKWRQLAPYLLTALSLGIVLGIEVTSYWGPRWDLFRRLAWITFDWRAKQASQWPAPVSTNLGFVFFSDETIAFFGDPRRVGPDYNFGLYWPRHLYAQVVRELGAQGAKVVGFDVFFSELQRSYDHVRLPGPDKTSLSPDAFFQHVIGELGNVVLGSTGDLQPHRQFRLGAAAMGDVSVERDTDGVFRRIKPFKDYRIWHEDLRMEGLVNGWDLQKAEVSTNAVRFPRKHHPPKEIPLEDGFFRPSSLRQDGQENPDEALEPAYQDMRVWHMGIVLAAAVLGLDLDQAEIEPKNQRIVLRGPKGLERILPLDAGGNLLIDWTLGVNDPRVTQEAFESVWAKDFTRQLGTNHPARFKDKLVVIGSTATGNELADRGATPVDKHGFLTANNWNVANSILTGQFIQPRSSQAAKLLIVALGLLSAWATMRLRPLSASGVVVLLGAGVWYAGLWVFIWHRHWLPLVTPLLGLGLTHGALLSYRAFFEQSERRRIRGIFSKIVAPEVVSELLDAEKLALGGARREVTVFFADVRGFTEYIDSTHARAEEHIRASKLEGAAAEAWTDLQARDALQTVNMYLGMISEIIKKHSGTLDKYIGDCVMAFWGAPTPNEQHALLGVRAAVEAQRSIYAMNQQRYAENQRREQENLERAKRGEAALWPLPLLTLGSGINTGIVTVGLMGSDATIVNYTVFGRDVNLASRLESVSGRGRIVIGERTFEQLRQFDSALAGTCIELPPVTVKGFRAPVKVYEVPWKDEAAVPSVRHKLAELKAAASKLLGSAKPAEAKPGEGKAAAPVPPVAVKPEGAKVLGPPMTVAPPSPAPKSDSAPVLAPPRSLEANPGQAQPD